MNESRLGRIVQVMGRHFGMSYADYLALYSIKTMRWMVHGDPTEWEPGRIANVNRMAREDMAWIDGLMAMSRNEFDDAIATIKQRVENGESVGRQRAW